MERIRVAITVDPGLRRDDEEEAGRRGATQQNASVVLLRRADRVASLAMQLNRRPGEGPVEAVWNGSVLPSP
jgi:hypothetical protein